VDGLTRYRDLVESLSQVVYEIDTTGRITYANRVAAEKFGITPAALERGVRVPELLIAEDRERAGRNMQRIAAGESVGTNEYTVCGPNGRLVPVVIDSTPILEDGKIVGMRGVLLDISRQKQLDAQLEESNRLAAIGTLAAGLAHEINNPLTSVLGNIQVLDLLLGKIGATLDPKTATSLNEVLAELVTGAKRVATITRDLSVLARADDGPAEPVLIDTAVDEAMGIARNQVAHSATMRREGATGLLVEGRQHRLVQVFTNLLVNAAQHLPESGQEYEIVISVRAAGESVVCEVRDTGPGIPEALLPRIFEPFVTGRPEAGTGMGLAICNRIVQSMSGKISARNLEGGGASFEVCIPVSRKSVPGKREQGTIELSGLKVLLVDDDASVRQVLALFLAGAQVETASGGAEAIELLATAHFDVVLCDLMMPGVSGRDVYQSVLADRPDQARGFVFITGGAFKPEIEAFVRTVDAPVMSKPIDHDELRQVVHTTARADSRA